MSEELLSNVGMEIVKESPESCEGRYLDRDHFAYMTQATGPEQLRKI
jgi:hypothetical protein